MTGIDATMRRQAALIVLVGVALRVLWMLLAHTLAGPINVGEASNAALAFARTGTIADAFFPGQGPTAHLLPTTIVLAGGVLRLFGPGSAAAQAVLAAWALAQVVAGYVLTAELFRRLGASRATLIAGLALLALVPVMIAQEAADFRYWEGALGYDLAVANLLWLAMLRERTGTTRDLVIAAALIALACFVSPPAGLAVAACWAIVAATRWPWSRTLRLAVLTAGFGALLFGAWTLRNERALGTPIVLRPNLGLEMAIANYDGALDPTAPRAALRARVESIHPYASAEAANALRAAGGEVAYSQRLGAATRVWIAAHPFAFARLTLRHYRQFYVPDTWQGELNLWPDWARTRIVALQVIAALGLAGLALGLWRRRRGYRLIALYLALTGLPYALVQPIPRYSYIIYPLLAFLAAELLVSLLRPGAAKER